MPVSPRVRRMLKARRKLVSERRGRAGRKAARTLGPAGLRARGKKAKATLARRVGRAKVAKRTRIAHRIMEKMARGEIKGPRAPYAVATEIAIKGRGKAMARKGARKRVRTGVSKTTARTRKLGRKRRSRKIVGSAYKFGNPKRALPPGFVPFDQREPKTGRIREPEEIGTPPREIGIPLEEEPLIKIQRRIRRRMA